MFNEYTLKKGLGLTTLTNADLNGSDLTGADLTGADISLTGLRANDLDDMGAIYDEHTKFGKF